MIWRYVLINFSPGKLPCAVHYSDSSVKSVSTVISDQQMLNLILLPFDRPHMIYRYCSIITVYLSVSEILFLIYKNENGSHNRKHAPLGAINHV